MWYTLVTDKSNRKWRTLQKHKRKNIMGTRQHLRKRVTVLEIRNPKQIWYLQKTKGWCSECDMYRNNWGSDHESRGTWGNTMQPNLIKETACRDTWQSKQSGSTNEVKQLMKEPMWQPNMKTTKGNSLSTSKTSATSNDNKCAHKVLKRNRCNND